MTRRLLATAALVTCVLTSGAFAQTAAPGRGGRAGGGGPARPPLFFSESWKALPTPPDDHGEWPAQQAGVASPNLQLSLHGPSGKEITLVAVRGRADVYPLNLWTGVTTSPIGATLRDKDSYVDLTDPLAKIRALLASREKYYRQADAILSTEFRPIKEVAQQVVYQFRLAQSDRG